MTTFDLLRSALTLLALALATLAAVTSSRNARRWREWRIAEEQAIQRGNQRRIEARLAADVSPAPPAAQEDR